MRWQPIETAPKVKGESILVCSEDGPGVDMVSWSGGKKKGCWVTEDGRASYSGDGFFTHWMPMPLAINEAPKLRVVK